MNPQNVQVLQHPDGLKLPRVPPYRRRAEERLGSRYFADLLSPESAVLSVKCVATIDIPLQREGHRNQPIPREKFTA